MYLYERTNIVVRILNNKTFQFCMERLLIFYFSNLKKNNIFINLYILINIHVLEKMTDK